MAYELRPFSKGRLFALLANHWTEEDQVALSPQAQYLDDYLSRPEINAQSVIIEDDYVDRDYLEDFSNYYVKSFPPYERYCQRLHFFSEPFKEADIESALLKTDRDVVTRMQGSYLGFIVVRPLPETVIGQTVLKTYPSLNRRYYPTIRDYQAHLFGIPLDVESLAFEEQDSSVAACATVALWSAFHKTHSLWATAKPQPVIITRDANVVRGPGRSLPSGGLNAIQIGEAIRSVGLEPEYYRVNEHTPLASLIYAYVSAGIPVILTVFIEGLEYHAITVVGYSKLDKPAAIQEPPYATVQFHAGKRIDKFYVHDDGVGPFSRLPIVHPNAIVHNPDPKLLKFPIAFESSWEWRPDSSGVPPPKRFRGFIPSAVIVPAYPKIRVTYFAVHSWLRRLMMLFNRLSAPFAGYGVDVSRLEWDLRLTTVNSFKQLLRKDYITHKRTSALLPEPMPRFMWRATMLLDEKPVVDLIADATDTPRSCPMLVAMWHDDKLQLLLQALLSNSTFRKSWRLPLHPRFYDFLQTGKASFP
jgi:hypothetical protein